MSKSSSTKQDVADYHMSLHYGICMGPVDALRGVYVDDKVLWEGEQFGYRWYDFNLPELFGGYEKEGGVAGTMHFLPGGVDQVLPDDLALRLKRANGLDTPGFRGVTTVFFTGYTPAGTGWLSGFKWSMNSPYLRPIKVKVSRTPKGLAPQYAKIGDEANPACIVYECLTNSDWGMGAPSTMLDTDAFEYAAWMLYNETFGISLMWTAQSEIQDFVTEILDHIQATLFVNPRNGLLTLKLIRDDYDHNQLRIITPDIATLTTYQRKLWGETTNEIVVTWTNPKNEEEETVSMQDLANINMQGGIVSGSRNYYGVRNPDLAMRLAARDLRLASVPLASMDLEINRSAWNILPGDVVKVTWPEMGITEIVMRVGSVDYGRAGDSKIKITCIEDIFSLSVAAFDTPAVSAWVDPAENPEPMGYVEPLTTPYFLVAADGLPALDEPDVYPMILAAQPGNDTIGFVLLGEDVAANGTLAYASLGPKHLVCHGQLPVGWAREATTHIAAFQNVIDGPGPVVAGLLAIGTGGDEAMELCLVDSYTIADGWTIQRGVLDTVPRAWPAGTPVWFLDPDSFDAIDSREYAAGTTPNWKIQTRTSKGVLLEADAPVVSYLLTERPHMPYRPANVAVAGSAWGPVTLTSSDPVAVTWSNRNRALEDSQIRKWTDATVAPETGQTTVVQVLDLAGNLVTEHADLAGTSFDVPIDSFADLSRGVIRVSSARDGLASLQAVEIEITLADRAGYGFDYGNNYGG